MDVFASADQEAMDKADGLKLLQAGSRKNFASNSVVLITPVGSTLNIKGLADLQQASVAKVTLGNPASVPIGRYARHAMEQARVWAAVIVPDGRCGIHAVDPPTTHRLVRVQLREVATLVRFQRRPGARACPRSPAGIAAEEPP